MKHVLPIKSTYISRWGLWEAVRELVQNAKDEEDENDSPMEISYGNGALSIINRGASLDAGALLLGETSKTGKRGLRGEHGEGLDLALLAAARANYKVKVRTGNETWTPALERVKAYGHNRCLVINTRKVSKTFNGVQVTIEMPEEDWRLFEKRFLFLTPPPRKVNTSEGELLLGEEYSGKIFVKGIYVMHAHSSGGFGFNFTEMRLDRDRQMIGAFDLQWAMARIVSEALGRDPAQFVGTILGLLDRDSDEVRYLDSHLESGSAGARAVADAFVAEHGPEAVPVRSMAESESLSGLGARGVVVSESAHNVLRRELGDFKEAAERLRQQPTKRYGWDQLTPREQDNLTRASAALASVTHPDLNVKARLQVVEFPDAIILGLCHLDTGEIMIARKECGDFYRLIRTLLHELAHAITRAKDGTRSHVDLIEDLWCSLYRAERGDPAPAMDSNPMPADLGPDPMPADDEVMF